MARRARPWSSASSAPTLDQGAGADALGEVAPHRGALPARGPAGRPARAAPPRARSRRWPTTVAADIAPGLAGDRGARARSGHRTTRGTSRRSTARCYDFARALPVRARARGLPGPHHHRHARRADLHVPAGRVAPLPGAAASRPRRPGRDERRRGRARYAIIDLDLSQYDQLARALSSRSSARGCRSSRRASTRGTPRSTG